MLLLGCGAYMEPRLKIQMMRLICAGYATARYFLVWPHPVLTSLLLSRMLLCYELSKWLHPYSNLILSWAVGPLQSFYSFRTCYIAIQDHVSAVASTLNGS